MQQVVYARADEGFIIYFPADAATAVARAVATVPRRPFAPYDDDLLPGGTLSAGHRALVKKCTAYMFAKFGQGS